MFEMKGAAGQLYSCGCASSTRSKITSCAMPRLKVALIYSQPETASAPIRESVQCIHRLLYVLIIAATHNTSRRTAAARLMIFDPFGLAQPHECRWQAATCHAKSAAQAPPTTPNRSRGNNCCTTQHVAKATDMLAGHDCIFHADQPQNECQLIDILDSLLAASICCHRGRNREI